MIVIAVARNPHLRFLSRAPASHPLRRGAAPMGQEVVCFAELGGQREKGRALLETSEIVFRGASRELRLKTPDGEAVFTLGAAAEKWLDKIKNPKLRLDKLGVKPGASVALVGSFEPGFLDELRGRTRATSSAKTPGTSDSIFFAADASKDLARVAPLAKTMKGPAALWIVYPKGQKAITENDVIAAGRKAGLKDVKVVAFSPTHTALKFVIPLAQR